MKNEKHFGNLQTSPTAFSSSLCKRIGFNYSENRYGHAVNKSKNNALPKKLLNCRRKCKTYRYCLQLFRITRDLRCQKRLLILGFSATSIKIRRFGAFCAGPLRKQKSLLQRVQNVMVCDWWISIRFVFLCFKFLFF